MRKLQLLLLATATLFMACSQEDDYFRINGATQGTMYSIIYHDTQSRFLRQEVDSVLNDFENSVSTFRKNSIISSINNGQKVKTDKYFRTVFIAAQDISQQTNGAFDITVAPLVNLWGFGFKNQGELSQANIDSILQHVGYKKASLCKNTKQLVLADSMLMFDFSAIAKGYSVDVVADYLQTMGINNFLVEIGGEIVARGYNPQGNKWTVGIDKPIDNALPGAEFQAIAQFTDRALATSGNYRRFYIKDGIRYAHTINPKTGYPVRHSLLSATVIAPNCMTADAYATAFMVMGVDSAKRILAKHQQLEALFVIGQSDSSNTVWTTKGFDKLIQKQHK